MSDEVQASDLDAPEVVQSEVEQTEAPEAVDSTQGQEKDPPAEGEAPEGEKPEEDDKVSASKARRERKRAAVAKAKAEAEAAQKEVERLNAELDRLKSRQKQPPKREDFQDYDDFMAAKTAHQALEMMGRDRIEDVEREAAETRRKAEEAKAIQQQQLRENWQAQVEEAKAKYADFEAVAYKAPISDEFAATLLQSDMAADLAYYLGMNPDQAREISAMGPKEQAGAMRMLERFVSVQPPRPRTQTQAPDPITPVTPKASAGKDPAKMTQAEFNAWRAAGGSY